VCSQAWVTVHAEVAFLARLERCELQCLLLCGLPLDLWAPKWVQLGRPAATDMLRFLSDHRRQDEGRQPESMGVKQTGL
jgi:hypothetical protein